MPELVKQPDSWGIDDDTFNEQPAEPNAEETTAEAPATEQQEAPEAPQSVNGVSLDDLSEDGSEPEKPAPPVEQEKPVGYDQFAADFRKYMGVDLEGAKSMLAELQAFRVETLVEKQQSVLRKSWGDAYDERFTQVAEYFSKLSPEKQKALDNPEGAELIWAKLSQEQTKKANSQQPNVPNFVSGRTTTATNRATTGNKPVMQYSEILAMSPSEYRKNQKMIQLAFDEGRVNMDDEENNPF